MLKQDEVYNENGGEQPQKVGTVVVKCDGCGANMVFNPDFQKLYCPHCPLCTAAQSSD